MMRGITRMARPYFYICFGERFVFDGRSSPSESLAVRLNRLTLRCHSLARYCCPGGKLRQVAAVCRPVVMKVG